jgi:hypothetical protein
MPLAALGALAHPSSPLSIGARIAPGISSALQLSAMATGSVAASATASASIQASAVAKFEALASLHASLNVGPLGPSTVPRISVMIQSMNSALAPLLQQINEILAPVINALQKLQQLTSAISNIQSLTGVNLALPNVSLAPPPVPTFSAMAAMSTNASASASAAATATATATATASAQASATANAIMALRLQGAAMRLGFPLPGQLPQLSNALGSLASLPALNPIGMLLSQAQAAISALLGAMQNLGVNLLMPNAIQSLNSILSTISQNLSASVSGKATATVNASAIASAQAAATAQALGTINANAVLNAAANIPFAQIPDLQVGAQSITLGSNLASLTGNSPFRSTPCSSCVVSRWK